MLLFFFQEDPVLCGAMLMLRFFPRSMLAYEVESKARLRVESRDQKGSDVAWVRFQVVE